MKHDSSIYCDEHCDEHCDKLLSLSKTRLTNYIGTLSPEKTQAPKRALTFALALNQDLKNEI